MTGFENEGVARQQNAETVFEANRLFRHSCALCCERNCRIECDSCAIAAAHSDRVALLQEMHAERVRQEEMRKRAAFSHQKIILVL